VVSGGNIDLKKFAELVTSDWQSDSNC